MALIGMIMACLGYLTYLFNPQKAIVHSVSIYTIYQRLFEYLVPAFYNTCFLNFNET